MRPALLVALAACDASRPPPPPPHVVPPARAPVDVDRALAELRAWPPVMIDRDGSHVLIEIAGSAGDGLSALRFELRDRDDRVVDHVTVVADGDSPNDPGLPERIARAGRWLAATPLVPAIELGPPGNARARTEIETGEGVTVMLDGGQKLEIDRGEYRALDRSVPADWRTGLDLTEQPYDCRTPGYLRRVYVAEAASLAVLDLGYEQSEMCHPDDGWHVVTW